MTSVAWCMPRSIRDQITNAGIAMASAQSSDPHGEALDPGGEHEQQAGEQRDRAAVCPTGSSRSREGSRAGGRRAGRDGRRG